MLYRPSTHVSEWTDENCQAKRVGILKTRITQMIFVCVCHFSFIEMTNGNKHHLWDKNGGKVWRKINTRENQDCSCRRTVGIYTEMLIEIFWIGVYCHFYSNCTHNSCTSMINAPRVVYLLQNAVLSKARPCISLFKLYAPYLVFPGKKDILLSGITDNVEKNFCGHIKKYKYIEYGNF